MIIKTPSRLHMSLIDLNGSYGRADGGIGLTINQPNFILKAEPSEKGITIGFKDDDVSSDIKDECNKKISNSANLILNHYNLEGGYHFEVEKAYLNHSGLGSGTQIALATSKLITKMNGIEDNACVLSEIVGRGGTSGVGTFAFDLGGFILDGGHSLKEKGTFLPSSASDAKPSQLIARYDFPEDWNILVVIPKADSSVTGQKEVNIFQANCPVPKKDVEQVSHLILMNLVPFMLEKDIESFGHCIDEIQTRGFKKVEVSLQPPKIKNIMNKMREFGAYGVGMSSFGPALYTVFDDNNKDIVKATKECLAPDEMVFVTKAQNHGYEILKK